MRVKTGFTRRHRHQKVLTRTKGMRMTRGKLYKVSKQADLHAGQYAYHGRRLKKRQLRSLWITRITAALKGHTPELKYSRFIKLLHEAKVLLDRKILADLAVKEPHIFKIITDTITKA